MITILIISNVIGIFWIPIYLYFKDNEVIECTNIESKISNDLV